MNDQKYFDGGDNLRGHEIEKIKDFISHTRIITETANEQENKKI